MLNIKYNATLSFTSIDIRDFSDSDLITYEVWANRPDKWVSICKKFFNGGSEDVELALDIIGLSLVSTSQNGERWSCGNRTNAVALHEHIESQSPDYGDKYIKGLAMHIFDQVIKNEDKRLGNSDAPLVQSTNGASQKQSKSVAKKA